MAQSLRLGPAASKGNGWEWIPVPRPVWDCQDGLPSKRPFGVVVVPGGSMDQQSYGSPMPRRSIYAIYAYIGVVWGVNVGIYCIHGAYGMECLGMIYEGVRSFVRSFSLSLSPHHPLHEICQRLFWSRPSPDPCSAGCPVRSAQHQIEVTPFHLQPQNSGPSSCLRCSI